MSSAIATLTGLLALLLVLGAGLLWLARQQRLLTGLPRGKIVSTDTGDWRRPEKALFSAAYHLAGRPDYVVKQGRHMIPVEVKPGRVSEQPYSADVLQLAAYCLLLEGSAGPPPYGLLRYRQKTYRIPYTRRLRRRALTVLDEIRRLDRARDVRPNHRDPRRCLGCGYHAHCAHRMA